MKTGRRYPLFLVGFLAWLVPGLGQLVVGRPRKALAMLIGIGGLYVGGLALSGFLCVNAHEYRLEFVAHALAGGPTLVTLYLTDGLVQTAFLPHFEVGRLYVAVAGLLNVVAVSDALGDAIDHNANVSRRRREQALANVAPEHPPVDADAAWLGAPEGDGTDGTERTVGRSQPEPPEPHEAPDGAEGLEA